MRRLLLFLVLAAGCGTETKDHCSVNDDCLDGDQCVTGVCQGPDHDDCGATHDKCAPEAVCDNTGDALACVCGNGFSGDGRTCADVDECSAATSACAAHAACANQPGSFSCTCDDHFTGDGTGYCVPSQFTKLVAAGGFSCGLSDRGTIWCWGTNYYGDLGDGTLLTRSRPTQVGTDSDWIDVSARRNVGCGLRADHSLWCWGDGVNGQLGNGQSMRSSTPVQVVSDKAGVGWSQVSVGRGNVCAIHTDGSLACWGLDKAAGTSHAMPTAVDGNTDWTAISSSDVFCGLRDGGHLYCWGRSRDGLLGLGDGITEQTTPTQVGSDTWRTVSVGYYNACAIHADGALWCWGNHLFLPTALHYGTSPQQVGTATDWQSIATAADSVMGLRAGGKAYAWGDNESGQLGVALAYEVAAPTPIGDAGMVWSQVSAGNTHGCGIANDQAYCWGSIGEGYLGNGETTTVLAPTELANERWATVATGGLSTLGLRNDGALMVSGFSADIGVGFGNTDPVWSPVRLGNDTWSAISSPNGSSNGSTCAISHGIPYCWGYDYYGQLGVGGTDPQRTPVAVHVPASTSWKEIAPGDHTCAITTDGALYCWGSASSGELGDGTSQGQPVTEPKTPLAGTWSHVVVSNSSTCAIRADHTMWCWGADAPFDNQTMHTTPTQVGTATDWDTVALVNGYGNGPAMCGIKTGGTLWCWGTTHSTTGIQKLANPTQVGSDTTWKTIAMGVERCGIKADGTLWCWDNEDILGDGSPLTLLLDGSSVRALTPTQIGSDTDWKTVSTGGPSCGTKTDGHVLCWGFAAAARRNVTPTPTPIR